MQNYIIIEKHTLVPNAFVVSSVANHYNASSSALKDVLKLEIDDFERNNGKVKKRKFKIDLTAIKRLIQDGYYVKITEDSIKYYINVVKPVTDKRPSTNFSTRKENGVILLLDSAEDWAQVMIEDYSTTNNI